MKNLGGIRRKRSRGFGNRCIIMGANPRINYSRWTQWLGGWCLFPELRRVSRILVCMRMTRHLYRYAGGCGDWSCWSAVVRGESSWQDRIKVIKKKFVLNCIPTG